MPLPPAEPPYAYVVEQRPLDACAPPACRIESKNVVGWWDEIQSDGRRGNYFRFGEPALETYYRRAVVKNPDKVLEFTLPPGEDPREYDGYFTAAEGTSWSAEIAVTSADGKSLLSQSFGGSNKTAIDASETEDMARYEDYFTHVRLPLPAAPGGAVTVRIRNTGSAPLVIGSPLVLRKVNGRKPRQAFFVFFDAVSEPLMTRMLTGSGDARSAWLGEAIAERGSFFARGASMGFNTPTFVRRFFRGAFYRTEGEPSLFGQGIDEEPPETAASLVARLAEQGFQTESIVANFLMMPTQTRLGFDGGYQNEQQSTEKMHPAALVRRFKYWLAAHRNDDAFAVVWISVTHGPFPPGRKAPPFAFEGGKAGHSQSTLDAIWRNLLDGVDHLEELTRTARDLSPDAERVWLVATDHGRTFTRRSMRQPTWLAPDTVFESDCEHCCLASFEEMSTPFGVVYDGVPPLTPRRVEENTSSVVVWRILEKLYGVRLGLPDTSTFQSAAVDAALSTSSWDDTVLASVGDSGAIRGLSGSWAYRSLAIRPQTASLWKYGKAVQLALTGTPNRKKVFLAEELYDCDADPFELDNQADARPGVVIELRRKLADWLAVHHDPPTHPRYEYTLRFARPTSLTFAAPRPFDLGVDGRPPERTKGRAATASGRAFVVREEDDPAAVVDVAGELPSGLLRCAATGLPLEVLSGPKVRLNLAVARTNCVTSGTDIELGPEDVAFSAKLRRESRLGADEVSSEELVEGLRRWGYVRDLDKSKKP